MSGVSRETVDPAVVASLFGENAEQIYRYVDLLLDGGVRRGVLGPREAGRIWSRHVLNCAVLGAAIPEGATVCDVGSGAGLPGVVLALARPDLEVTLVEPQLRRVRFLSDVRARLDLASLEIKRSRAEEQAGRRTWEVVVARAVAPLERLVEWTVPLCIPGGSVLAMKGETAAAELEAARPTLRAWQTGTVGIERYGHGVVSPLTTVVRIETPQQPDPGAS